MRYLLTTFLILSSLALSAQKKKPSKNAFLDTQWYLGFFGGANLSMANPTTSFFGYEPLNYNEGEIEKQYDNYTKPGFQAGLVFMFYAKGFTFGVKPGIHNYAIEYSRKVNWAESTNPDNSLEIQYKHTNNFNYFEIPLSIQYDIIKGKIRPFVGVGGYYGLLLNANATIERSGTDLASGSTGSFTNQSKTIGTTDLFIKSSVGISGFVGVSYDPGNIRITMDVGYKYGLNNISNTENRYLNNELSAIGDATDDLQLQNIYLTLGFVFPLKFISKNFNAIK